MATITEDYCDFETAQLLKEKGFDVPCLAHWFIGTNKHFVISTTPQNWNEVKTDLSWLSCPTLQMAMKWLREVHKCYITFTWEFKEYDKNYKPIYKDITWSFNIAIPKYNSARKGDGSYFDSDSDKEYDSYEQACEAAIKYCLENLI